MELNEIIYFNVTMEVRDDFYNEKDIKRYSWFI